MEEQPGGRWMLPKSVVVKVVDVPERQVMFPVVRPYVGFRVY